MKRKRIPSEKDDSGRVRKSPKGNRKDKHSAKKNYSKSEDGKAVKTTKPFKQKIVKGTTKPAHAKATKGRDGRATISGDAKANKLDHRAWKEMTENRKRKRKPYYDLQKELVASWEKMRQRNIKNEERSRLISEIMKKMKGKIPDIAGSHVSSRVLQTCIKYCEPAEKDSVYEELRPHFLALACNTYAVHLMTKMLDHASKEQLQQMISSLHGHVAAFLRHPVGSAVVEHAFKLANGTQKQDLLSEIYSAEFRLFKGLIPKGKGRKKIVKGMKGHIVKIAHDEYGGVCGRRPILHLLCPNAPRYFSADVLATLRASIASLSTSTGQPESVDDDPSERPKVSSEIDLSDHINDDNDQKDRMEGDPKESQELGIKSKKDSSLRRSELLVSSGFAQKLTEMCIQNVGELLRSQYGKDVIFEDSTHWPVIDPLPSYGRGRELPGGRHSSLINAYNVTDVVITGDNGTIDGQGAIWWHWFHNQTLNYTRPHLIEVMDSTDVVISNLTFLNSPFWNIHPVYCSNVHIHNVTILAPFDSPNTDGIDPDSSSDVCIEDCYISTGDDVIAIKSGWDEYGIAYGRPSSNIIVRRVIGETPTSAGLALGSEMSGGITDVHVESFQIFSNDH